MNTYRISIKKLSDHPLVSASGGVTREVVYTVASVETGTAEEWSAGTVQGDTLTRCLRIKEVGEITVSEPSDWKGRKPDGWQETVVNLALDHSSSESA